MSEREEKRPVGKTGKKAYRPTRFMLPTSHYDKKRADRAVSFIQSLKHTKGVWAGKPFLLFPWQEQIIRDIFGTIKANGYRQFNTAFVEICKKAGKQLALDTPVFTTKGWKTMGTLTLQDRVFDENGSPCNIVAFSEIDDTEQCYRLVFRDGSYIDAGAQHQWNVQVTNNGKREKIWTTEEIYRATIRYRERHKNDRRENCSVIRIPVAKALQMPESTLPVDPYVYGLWLGNGNTVKPEITICTRDVESFLKQVPYEITNAWEQKGGGSWIFRIPALKPILLSNFRQKHIPDEYMCASEEQRWALLQGLMDSDGCIGARKAQSVYVSTIKDLADNVRELLWSLGIKNAMTEEPSTRYGVPTGETLYTIRFTTFDDQPTSRLKRKYDRKRERTKKTRSCFHYLQDIQPLPYRVKMRCIQVDSPSRCYLAGRSLVPTHNSELAAGIALYMLCADNEEGAEIYGCANDRQQAAIVFDVAREIVQQSPILRERIRIIDSQKRMVYMPTHSIYQALSSEVASKYGYNVHACIFDELLGQSNRKLYETMTQGSGAARKQPLNFVITTAGSDRNSICYEVHRKAVDQLEGRKYDSTFYPVVYSAPETADWTDPKVWARANPSLGRTVDVEYYEQRCKSAMENPAEEIHFRQFHLCQWTNTSVRWMPMDKWDACAGRVDARMLEGRPCYAGLDLSSTTDLTTLVLVFPPLNEDDAYTVLPFFWLPEDTLALRVRRDHVMYDVWEKQGFLKTTEGNVVHYGFIEQFICQLGERYNIREIAYDRWNASMMVQTLQDDGFTMIPFGQGYKDMSPPTKELMRIVLEKKLNHGGHPVLRWNMDNAYVRTDPAGNIKIDKEKSTEKVDGAVALVMALDRAMKNLNGGDSVYNHRGLLIL